MKSFFWIWKYIRADMEMNVVDELLPEGILLGDWHQTICVVVLLSNHKCELQVPSFVQ
jgi:hypothetical protein